MAQCDCWKHYRDRNRNHKIAARIQDRDLSIGKSNDMYGNQSKKIALTRCGPPYSITSYNLATFLPWKHNLWSFGCGLACLETISPGECICGFQLYQIKKNPALPFFYSTKMTIWRLKNWKWILNLLRPPSGDEGHWLSDFKKISRTNPNHFFSNWHGLGHGLNWSVSQLTCSISCTDFVNPIQRLGHSHNQLNTAQHLFY